MALRMSLLAKKNTPHMSKEKIVDRKLFRSRKGSHGEDVQIGRKFRHSPSMHKPGSIGPDVSEFDDLIAKISGSPGRKKKKSLFNKEY